MGKCRKRCRGCEEVCVKDVKRVWGKGVGKGKGRCEACGEV